MAKMSARERMRAAANEGVKHSQENTDYQPTSYSTFYKLPDGVPEYRPKGNEKGIKNYLDIIPFTAGENMPDGVWKNTSAVKNIIKEYGNYHILEVFTHKNIGPANETVICPKETFKSGIAKGETPGCPICDELAIRQAEEKDSEKRKDIWKELKTVRRCMYNVVVRDEDSGGEEEAKGVQVMVLPHFNFQKKLDAISERKSGTITYADPDMGKMITFTLQKTGSGKDTNLIYDGHGFEDRVRKNPKTGKLEEYMIEDDYLENTIKLEDTLVLYSYEELEALLKKGVKKTDNEEEEDKKEEKEEEPVVGSRATRRGRLDRGEDPPPKTRVVEDEEGVGKEEEVGEENDLPFEQHECPYDLRFGNDYMTDVSCVDDCPGKISKACQAENIRIKTERAARRGNRSK